MPGVTGSGPTPFFAAQLCGVSAKLNHSNSMPAIGITPSFSARFKHALQDLARADRERRAVGVDELAQEEGHVAVPGHAARRAQVQPRQRVGEAMLPAGDLGVVVALVLAVPAEHHVAEAEAAFHRAEELVLVQVLAAQDAVDVAAGDLDLVRAVLARRRRPRDVPCSSSPCCRSFRVPGAPEGMPISRSVSATALTACCISTRPMAPMQPTRKVSTCVSLPG